MSTMHQGQQGGEEDRALQELRGHLTGSVIEPQDPLYDEARAVWNGMIDVRPRAVIRAAAVGDIDPVLHTARRTGLPLAVRGGGHNIAGHGTVEGGLVLDLGQLRGVEVDVETPARDRRTRGDLGRRGPGHRRARTGRAAWGDQRHRGCGTDARRRGGLVDPVQRA